MVFDFMPLGYEIPQWLTAAGSMGKMYSDAFLGGQEVGDRRRAQQFNQGVQNQELQMAKDRAAQQQQEYQAKKIEAARNMAARQKAQQSMDQIAPDDPNRVKKIQDIFLKFSMETGNLSSGMIPQSPTQVIDLSNGTPSASPKKDLTSPQFKVALQDALKGAGATPTTPDPTAATKTTPPSGGAWIKPPQLISYGKGQVKYIPGIPIPKPSVIPKGAIGVLSNGERITNSPPGAPFNLSPRQVRYDASGKPMATNTIPKTAERPTTIPRLSDAQVEQLGGADRTNYLNSIAGSTTNLLNKATAPTGGTAAPPPMPINKSDLQKGQAYTTPRGVAVWDGTNFVQQ